MGTFSFSETDQDYMRTLGIPEVQVLDQIEIFKRSAFHVRLERPCTVNDGIRQISPRLVDTYHQYHRKAASAGRLQKFVPASGAATRMFQSLLQIYYVPQFLDCDELYKRAEQGVAVACDFVRFMEELHRFPFLDDLRAVVARDGSKLATLIKQHRFRTILEYLLTPRGLNYGALPKGLLKFHRYPAECRTSFDEHLVEACDYLKHENGVCHIHFTISPEHEEGFKTVLEKARLRYEGQYEACFSIGFSHQKLSTNTIAVDLGNRPFRERSGLLHFRPGGHGALLENLNDLKGDIVYIKNVDNIIPDRLKGLTSSWKKVLGGYLVEIEATVHGYLRSLRNEAVSANTIDDAVRFAGEELLLDFPADFRLWPLRMKRDLLLDRLNRPIRVCGVVPNSGDPGGAPFWVQDRHGNLSVQIVEQSQVDFVSPEQREIWNSSTHFNPVDLVCSLRDYEGNPFDLTRFVDHEAVFISRKSKDGQDIKALELPGLWNGSMAEWITVIVEVPRATFNPVKTIYDLLKPEHQP